MNRDPSIDNNKKVQNREIFSDQITLTSFIGNVRLGAGSAKEMARQGKHKHCQWHLQLARS